MFANPLKLLFIYYSMAHANNCFAQDKNIEFDSDFMNIPESNLSDIRPDLSELLRNDLLSPGVYPVNILINNKDYGQYNIEFIINENQLIPLIPIYLLNLSSVKSSLLSSNKIDSRGVQCDDITSSLTDAKVYFDTKTLTLRISIPQIYIDSIRRGYVPPVQWDQGINATRINYQFALGKNNAGNGQKSETSKAYINSGINLSGWQLRSSMLYDEKNKIQTYNTFMERDLPGTFGRLSAGELFTKGDVMESIPFKGFQVGSDVEMIPDSMQGYAPVIRGIANGQAKVEIKQHGYSLYTAYVPSGPFEIKDLNTATNNGDLEITITESDGEVRRFIQPYATLGNLLRQDSWRYDISGGTYDENSNDQKPTFLQFTGARGLKEDYTASGGILLSQKYKSLQAGIGKGLGHWGAVSIDMNYAHAKLRNNEKSGRSYSLRYGKAFESGTDIRFSGYRYSSRGYRTLSDAMYELNLHDTDYRFYTRRSRVEANVTQNIDEASSMYLMFSQQKYWGKSATQSQMQLGFNTMIENINLGVFAVKSLKERGLNNNGTDLSINISIPLGGLNINSSFSRSSSGNYANNFGINGTAGETSQANYSIDFSKQQLSSNQISAIAGYRMPWAQITSGVTKGGNFKSGNISATGSLLAHSSGIEFGPYLGETVALIQVDNTPGVENFNYPGNPTNARGYSVIPYIRPYRTNRIRLDTRNTENDIIISGASTEIVPRRGAIIKANFKAFKATQILLTIKFPDGRVVPFGSRIMNEFNRELSLISSAGQGLISTDDDNLSLTVIWGGGSDDKCNIFIKKNDGETIDKIRIVEKTCYIN